MYLLAQKCHICFPVCLYVLQARKAILSLVEQLRRHKDKGSSLWLSSPLTRALDTMLLAYPDVQQLAKGQLGDASAAHLAALPCSHRVMVLRCE